MVTGSTSLRVVFFGTPEFAVPTLEALNASRHAVVAVITQPDRARGRGQKSQPSPVKIAAERVRLPVMQPERLSDDAFLDQLRAVGADLGVVAAYGKILTDAVLAIPCHGLLNVHASLLPKYRGAAPIHRAVMAGETGTGITIMRVVKALDAGPMISRQARPIGEDETSADVERDLAAIGAQQLVEAVDALADGRSKEKAQDESQATYARKIDKRDGIVDWSRPARDIHNQIRGLYPWPHAYTDLRGERIILLRSHVDPGAAVPLAPGTLVARPDGGLQVHTGDGLLRVLSLQREGRRPVSATEFIAGARIRPGDRFMRPTASS